MEQVLAKVEELAAHIKEYADNRIDSAKLNAAEKISKLAATIIAVALVLLVFVFFIAFASISLAYVFAKLTGEIYLGFLIVAGIYFLCGWLIWFMKENIIRLPIMNNLLRQVSKDEDSDE